MSDSPWPASVSPQMAASLTWPSESSILEGPGSIIDRYRLIERIGEGGMGVVYRAEQEEPYRQQVALKIIKPGMDTRQVVSRFEAERQALALMDHPGIARVSDGGTTETGRPYFVMQFVNGETVMNYCNRERLPTRDRLGLFIMVCEAVQHAHQKGIIHRDLKPSNILVATVDGKPAPVVIDFGVAKAIEPKVAAERSWCTQQGQFLGTPAYMSPEQARPAGLDVDTRTDVYSLGVLLYELLVGRTPFDSQTLLDQGFEEFCRVICDEDPEKPSTRLGNMTSAELEELGENQRVEARRLGTLLRGDMDWIVMKAIEKDRTRRYQTPTSLAEDVRRFLAGQPVSAVAPTLSYRLGKFVRRNRAAVSAAVTIAALLVAGAATSTWQAIQATRARDSARLASLEAEEVTRFLERMLERVRPANALGKDTTLLRTLLDETVPRLRTELRGQPKVDFRLRRTIGRTYEAIGAFTNSEALLRDALQLARQEFGSTHTNVAATLVDLALTLQWQLRNPEATNAVHEALAICLRTVGPDHPLAGQAHHRLGSILRSLRDYGGAEKELMEAIRIFRGAPGVDPSSALSARRDLAAVLYEQNRFDDMEPVILDVVERRRALDGPEHPDTLKALELLALLRQGQGRFEEAKHHHAELLEIRRRILPAGHANLTTTMDYLAVVLSYVGQYADAEKLCREALEQATRSQRSESGRTLVYRSNLAEYVRNQGRYEESESLFREVLAAQDRLLGPRELNRFETRSGLSIQYCLVGRYPESETLAREVLSGRLSAGLPPRDSRIGDALSQLVLVLLVQGKQKEAEPFAQTCLEIRQQGPPDDWRRAVAQSQLGAVLSGLGRDAESGPLLREGYEGLKRLQDRIPAIERIRVIEAGDRLLRYNQSTGTSSGDLNLELSMLRSWAGGPNGANRTNTEPR